MDYYLQLVKNIEKATGLSLSNKELIEILEKYAEFIIFWNGQTNLTSLVYLDDIFETHFFDSYTCLYLWKKEWKKVYDVGTGAGFPGLPLALVLKNTNFILVESNEKKCYILKNFIETFELENVTVINDRAENLSFADGDCVLTRAVSRIDIVLEITCRLLKKGGFNLLMRGGDYFSEVKNAKNKIEPMNYKLEKTLKIIDNPKKITALALYSLTDYPPKQYPRRYAKIKRG